MKGDRNPATEKKLTGKERLSERFEKNKVRTK
jgi:hypothetical protein